MEAPSKHTDGTRIMNMLNEGSLVKAPTAYVQKIRAEITTACEELLDVGARIRPLYVEEKQIGWVRGVHLYERKALQRWVYDDLDMIEQIVSLGTSLPKEEIAAMGGADLRMLSRVVAEMTDSDLKLYPYLNAFATTTVSEQLWFGRGTTLTAYRNLQIEMPDGYKFKILTSSEHARMWASLCHYREQAKRRLDANMNALLTVRPHVGKGADSLANDLKATARSLMADSLEPWTEIVTHKAQVDVEDGWAHGEDNSEEGTLRELQGMVNNDRHERFISWYEEKLKTQAEDKQREVDAQIEARGGLEFIDESYSVMTNEEMHKRMQDLRGGHAHVRVDPAKFEAHENLGDRLAKYR